MATGFERYFNGADPLDPDTFRSSETVALLEDHPELRDLEESMGHIILKEVYCYAPSDDEEIR